MIFVLIAFHANVSTRDVERLSLVTIACIFFIQRLASVFFIICTHYPAIVSCTGLSNDSIEADIPHIFF